MTAPLTVFIFRRDYRIIDNVEWSKLAGHTSVLPIFIFNPRQIEPAHNPYRSDNSVQFLCESLLHLQKEYLPVLRFFESSLNDGKTGPGIGDIAVLNAIHKQHPIGCVAWNGDYTPYARARDHAIAKWCAENNIRVQTSMTDYSLVDPTTMEKPYQVFTPFYKKYVGLFKPVPTAVRSPIKFAEIKKLPYEIAPSKLASYYKKNPELALTPGRQAALAILAHITRGKFSDYDKTRDTPANEAGTTRLSAYIKFGCVSVREVRAACVKAKAEGIVRELYWRAFYDQVTWHFPHVLQGQNKPDGKNLSMKSKYDALTWPNKAQKLWEAFQTGKTGFPFVDAGIRQLLKTGYMHNRARMVVASFLVKDLHIDWREGERFFAQHLTDYDPSANNGGWQWSAGTGADAQPWYRVFNPTTQLDKFDPDGAYVQKHAPDSPSITPIVDHAKEANRAKELYKKISKE